MVTINLRELTGQGLWRRLVGANQVEERDCVPLGAESVAASLIASASFGLRRLSAPVLGTQSRSLASPAPGNFMRASPSFDHNWKAHKELQVLKALPLALDANNRNRQAFTGMNFGGHQPGLGRQRTSAFSRVELVTMLCVATIVAAILLPTLAGTRERGRRVLCRKNLTQFYLALAAYAADNKSILPSGIRDNGDQCISFVSTAVRKALVHYAGGNENFLYCPNLNFPTAWGTNGGYHESAGYILGYFYMGGHTDTPWNSYNGQPVWISPQKMTDNPSLVLAADSTMWSEPQKFTMVPHGRQGLIYYGSPLNSLPGGMPVTEVGMGGCNVSYLNGAVLWKPAAKMSQYYNSGFGVIYIGSW